MRRYAEERGVRIGAINPNLFGDDAIGSGASAIRTPPFGAALDHCRECIEIAGELGST